MTTPTETATESPESVKARYTAVLNDDSQARLFGQAVLRQRKSLGLSQGDLAAKMPSGFRTQAAVSRLERGKLPKHLRHVTVFSIEEVLDLPSGSLSRWFGYLPLTASEDVPDWPDCSVVDAVASDVLLSDADKTILLALYKHLADNDTA